MRDVSVEGLKILALEVGLLDRLMGWGIQAPELNSEGDHKDRRMRDRTMEQMLKRRTENKVKLLKLLGFYGFSWRLHKE